MKTHTLFLLLFCLPMLSSAQPQEATLLGHWSDDNITPTSWLDSRYNDIWGIVVNDQEFGIIGSTEGVHFIDLSNPETPTEVAFVQGAATGTSLVHRDFKSYQHYLYTVADEGPSTLQIIDMSGLPASVEKVYDSNEFIVQAHNIFIDEANARLYACGGNGFNVRILSLEDPENPTLLASYPNAQLNIPYVHDLYVRDHIGYLNAGNSGFWVVDFSDPADAVLLGTMTNYPQAGYNHSGWLSDDGNYYYLCDETHGMDIKVVDVRDFSDMKVVATMNAESAPTQIPHNVMLRGDLLFASYYYDGLQVFDVSDPLAPRRIAYYDTYPGPDDDFYQGAWGVYVFPSGRSLISDMNHGFFYFDVVEVPPDFSISVSQSAVNMCYADTTVLDLAVGQDFSPEGVGLSIPDAPTALQYFFSQNPVQPGQTVQLSIIGTLSFENLLLNIVADDGTNQTQTTLDLTIRPLPGMALLETPPDGATDQVLSPTFDWEPAQNVNAYRLEIATDPDAFEQSIVFSQTLQVTLLELPIQLEENQTYYWRVVTLNDCGDSASPILSFTTGFASSVFENPLKGFLQLYPNPAAQTLHLRVGGLKGGQWVVRLLDARGHVLRQLDFEGNRWESLLPVDDLPSGVYFLRLDNGTERTLRKVIVE